MNGAWPTFSFTEMLRPPGGWKTNGAILSTYSADLVAVVTTLLSLTGCELDEQHAGSRVELVKAIEVLRGRVCVLAQAGRVVVPNSSRPILKLLDKFVRIVDADESKNSWHPKAVLIRFQNGDDASDCQWRMWLGSRNLTRAFNWEAGVVLVSRSDGKGQSIPELPKAAEVLATHAAIATFPPKAIAAELAKLTWDCPPGSEVRWVRVLGPTLSAGFPEPTSDVSRIFVISPFLDAPTVRNVSKWGSDRTRRTLVSTSAELQRLRYEDEGMFARFDDVRIQPLPDLPAESADIRDEDTSNAVASAESEEVPLAGLHAKLLFAARAPRRQLWLGSANATERGWGGRNFEMVAELCIARDAADALEEFVATCDKFQPSAAPPHRDEDEDALENARKVLSVHWPLKQVIREEALEIIAASPPALDDSTISIEVATLGGAWTTWPLSATRLRVPGLHRQHRSNFLQIRALRRDRMCAWIQIARCDPAPDDERDRSVIAQYLDPRTFLMWLRSLLNDELIQTGGGDWDADTPPSYTLNSNGGGGNVGFMPTVEEILRSWARDPSAFFNADQKVKDYLTELERRAKESGATDDAELLGKFRRTWETLAAELQ